MTNHHRKRTLRLTKEYVDLRHYEGPLGLRAHLVHGHDHPGVASLSLRESVQAVLARSSVDAGALNASAGSTIYLRLSNVSASEPGMAMNFSRRLGILSRRAEIYGERPRKLSEYQ
jgi:hypothetical protein